MSSLQLAKAQGQGMQSGESGKPNTPKYPSSSGPTAAMGVGVSALEAKRAAAASARKLAEERVERVTREAMSIRGGGRGRGRGGRGGRGQRGKCKSERSEKDKKSSAPVCRFFLQGRCRNGEFCKFKHTHGSFRGQRSASFGSSSSHSVSSSSQGQGTDPFFVMAISRAKQAQDNEPPLAIAAHDDAQTYSIDVECVATGTGHTTTPNNRTPGRIALVGSDGTTLLDEYVKFPDHQNIVSYLTPLTGITPQLANSPNAKPLAQIVQLIRDILPAQALIVGQSISHDLQWLGLEHKHDYAQALDISQIFRQRLPLNIQQAAATLRAKHTAPNNTNQTLNHLPDHQHTDQDIGFPTKYRIFSLRHVCINLLNLDPQQAHHDPTLDAKYSLQLFHKYKNAPAPQLRAIRDALHRAPITSSFSYQTPIIDGVCLSRSSYKYKWAARFIWAWYTSRK